MGLSWTSLGFLGPVNVPSGNIWRKSNTFETSLAEEDCLIKESTEVATIEGNYIGDRSESNGRGPRPQRHTKFTISELKILVLTTARHTIALGGHVCINV